MNTFTHTLTRFVICSVVGLSALFAQSQDASAQFTFNYSYSDFMRALYDEPKEFDYFDPYTSSENTVNSYLLSQLAFKIYSDAPNLNAFRTQMEDQFEPMGLHVDHVFMNFWTGTDGAVFSNDEAVFVVFRGTSSEGTPSPWSDYVGDVDDDFRKVTVDGKSFWVHKGFWHNVDSEIQGIREVVETHYNAGKKVWVTGHSLGGANATLAALRLHYQYRINVQGLHTFGAPKVGDSGMKATFQGNNYNGIRLDQRTTRWVMHNDPAPTFFQKALIYNKGWKWHYYQHVGVQHKIYFQTDGTYNFYFNTTSSPSYDSLSNLLYEHMWYDIAHEDRLYQEGFGYVINDY